MDEQAQRIAVTVAGVAFVRIFVPMAIRWLVSIITRTQERR